MIAWCQEIAVIRGTAAILIVCFTARGSATEFVAPLPTMMTSQRLNIRELVGTGGETLHQNTATFSMEESR